MNNETIQADNTGELIEAMKEGFSIRLADVEAKLKKATDLLRHVAGDRGECVLYDSFGGFCHTHAKKSPCLYGEIRKFLGEAS